LGGRGHFYLGLTNSIDELAIYRENFYTPALAGEITHVQCAEKTPKENAQAQVQKAAPASKV
jgi:hypothetical protein